MIEPPLLLGAENEIVTVVGPVTVTAVMLGALGEAAPLATAMEIDAVLELVVLVAVTVKEVAVIVSVGVPLITPVAVEKDRPVGGAGVIAHDAAAPPELVGVRLLMTALTTNVKVEEE